MYRSWSKSLPGRPLTCPGLCRRGVAAVEMAFLLPLLLLLLLGIWEVGRLVHVQQLMTNAAREGARQASTGLKRYADVRDAVVNYLHNAGITNTSGIDVQVTNVNAGSSTTYDPSSAAQLDHLRVTVALPYDNVRWAFINQITNVRTLRASADWYSMKDLPVTVSTTLPVE